MGVFLAGPLMEELKAAANDRSALLGAARRILEVLVPLVYRPAMKVIPVLPYLPAPPHQLLSCGLIFTGVAQNQDEAPVGRSVSRAQTRTCVPTDMGHERDTDCLGCSRCRELFTLVSLHHANRA